MVGASWDDENGDLSGSAYIYERKLDNSWQEVVKLVEKNGSAGNFFGISVALSGEYLLIGTTDESAYLYERQPNGDWLQIQKLVAMQKLDEHACLLH